RWVTLDATPADERLESVESMQTSVPTFRDLVSFLQDFWNSHVVNMNIGQQRDSVYGPLQAIGEELWKTAKGEESPKKLWEAVKAFLMSPEEWFSWAGGLVSFGLLLLI